MSTESTENVQRLDEQDRARLRADNERFDGLSRWETTRLLDEIERLTKERDEAYVIEADHVAQAEEQRERAEEAEASCAAMRAALEKLASDFEAGGGGFPLIALEVRNRLGALATDAGKPILDALAKAEAALVDDACECGCCPSSPARRAALAAIQALGIRGGA